MVISDKRLAGRGDIGIEWLTRGFLFLQDQPGMLRNKGDQDIIPKKIARKLIPCRLAKILAGEAIDLVTKIKTPKAVRKSRTYKKARAARIGDLVK